MRKRFFAIAIVGIWMALGLCGCSLKDDDKPAEQSEYPVFCYVVDETETYIFKTEYTFRSELQYEQMNELFEELHRDNSEEKYLAAIPKDVQIVNWELDDEGLLTVIVNEEYYKVSEKREILLRAALVRTVCQLEDVYQVQIYVEQNPLTINDKEVGRMNEYMFVDFIGMPHKVYDVTLYFQYTENDSLIEVSRRLFPDNYNTVEQAVLEMLIGGPESTEGKAKQILPSDTKINSVKTRNGICYIDFSNEFLKESLYDRAEILLQSIANTVIKNFHYINSVSVSMDGKKLQTYGSYKVPELLTLSMTNVFEAEAEENE